MMVRHYSSTHLQNKYQAQVVDATFKRRAMRRLVEFAESRVSETPKPEASEVSVERWSPSERHKPSSPPAYSKDGNDELRETDLMNEERNVTAPTKRNFWYHVALLDTHAFPLTEDADPEA